jgi:Zn-dependent peptidase ImmA (M78 family)
VPFSFPRQRLLEDVGANRRRITYYEIIRLKHTYGVSAAVMLIRLGQVGVLHPATVQHSFATFARSWRTSEPEPIRPDHGFAAFEKPRRFERLVARAVGEGLISSVRAAALLNESLGTVEQRISGPTTE